MIEINNKNAKKVFGQGKKTLKKLGNKKTGGWLVPSPYYEVDRKKYKGKGRPKKTDYIRVDLPNEIKKIIKKHGS